MTPVPNPAAVTFVQLDYDEVTETTDAAPGYTTFFRSTELNGEGDDQALGYVDRDGTQHELPLPGLVNDGAYWSMPDNSITIRDIDPYDALLLSTAGVPQPVAVIRADILRGGGVLAQELDAVVAGDNTVATLMLDTGQGVYVRYSGDWQKLSADSTSLDDMQFVAVGPGALDVWDAGEASGSTVLISDLPIPTGSGDVLPLPVAGSVSTTGGGEGLLIASGVMIPPINTVDDLDLGLRFASIHPSARWYVSKRAEALGAGAKIPSDWKSSGVVRPFPTRVEQLDADVSTPSGVLAAARRYSALCAAGFEPEAPAFTLLMMAADQLNLGRAADVLTASRWTEWLHPRGMDGRFIEVNQFVDVFGKPGDEDTLTDPAAGRRRAKIKGLFDSGAEVEYYGPDGNPIAPDPANGYPEYIPQKLIGKKISSAPNRKATIPALSSKDEFEQELREPMSQEQYDQAIVEFNDRITKEMHPERSAAQRGAGPMSKQEYADHVDYVTEVTNAGLGKQPGEPGLGLGSDAAMKDSYGRWGQEHLKRMLVMADKIYAQETQGKPTDRKVLFIGGLPGSGKSTLLGEMAKDEGFQQDDWVTINPDLVKDEMIRQGWFPQIEGLTPNETAGFIHAQSSEIAHMLERLAMKDGYNLIYDTTMGGSGGWLDQTMGHLASYDYQPPEGIFINATPEHSLASIAHRHQVGLEKYRKGTGERRGGKGEDMEVQSGGRFVPNKVVQAQMGDSDTGGMSTNLRNFERLKPKFARWANYQVANQPGEKPAPELGDHTPDLPGSVTA